MGDVLVVLAGSAVLSVSCCTTLWVLLLTSVTRPWQHQHPVPARQPAHSIACQPAAPAEAAELYIRMHVLRAGLWPYLTQVTTATEPLLNGMCTTRPTCFRCATLCIGMKHKKRIGLAVHCATAADDGMSAQAVVGSPLAHQ